MPLINSLVLTLKQRSLKKAKHTLYLRVDAYIIEVISNSPALIARLQNYYAYFQTRAQKNHITVFAMQGPRVKVPFKLKPRKRELKGKKIKEAYTDCAQGRLVRKIRTGMVMVMDGTDNFVIGPCIGNLNQVVNFINNRYIEMILRKKCLLMHCAGVAKRNKGVALCGSSGAGKSTLALHLLQKNIDFISNDRLMVQLRKKGLTMYGVPKYPRVNPGTLINDRRLWSLIPPRQHKILRQMPLQTLWSFEEKYDVFLHEHFEDTDFRLKSSLQSVIILNWKNNQKSTMIKKVDITRRKDLYPCFMKDPGIFYQPAKETDLQTLTSPDTYTRFLRKCAVYEISGGIDFPRAKDFCLQLLR
jgi:HprK-related kinase B